MKLGEFQIHVISDGLFTLDAGTMFGIVPKVVWSKLVQADANNMAWWGTNCLVVDTGRHKVLIETGLGSKLTPKQRQIYGRGEEDLFHNRLSEAGFSAADIDFVIATHLHVDHAGGMTEYRDHIARPRFPNAKYVLQRSEWEAATHPHRLSRAVYLPENFDPLVREGCVLWMDGDGEIVPGIQVYRTGAHTPGHQAIKISSASKTLFCPGDLIPARWHVRQTFVTAYDWSAVEVMRVKSQWLEQALNEAWIIHWYHDPDLVFGTVGLENGNFVAKAHHREDQA